MTLELTAQEPVQAREDRVREIFKQNGNAISLRALAKACITAGVWTRAELDAIAIRSVIDACRKVLRQKDASGIPANGPTTDHDDDGAPVWKARQGWLFPDYELNIKEHIGQRDENHSIALLLAEEAEGRYGSTVTISGLAGN